MTGGGAGGNTSLDGGGFSAGAALAKSIFGGGGGGGSVGSGGVAVRLPGTMNGRGTLGICAVNTRNDGSGVFGGTRSGGDMG